MRFSGDKIEDTYDQNRLKESPVSLKESSPVDVGGRSSLVWGSSDLDLIRRFRLWDSEMSGYITKRHLNPYFNF